MPEYSCERPSEGQLQMARLTEQTMAHAPKFLKVLLGTGVSDRCQTAGISSEPDMIKHGPYYIPNPRKRAASAL